MHQRESIKIQDEDRSKNSAKSRNRQEVELLKHRSNPRTVALHTPFPSNATRLSSCSWCSERIRAKAKATVGTAGIAGPHDGKLQRPSTWSLLMFLPRCCREIT